ncbi:LysM peptidoglycan-binding domain-containing protein [Niallia sp. Krafla_26]|uniref:LysM peptidoglycan-binding domain-containing protein n=1 Tax=Niallia sp. Krafla_26 TaxID=3064703 RepID=UPI003D18687F
MTKELFENGKLVLERKETHGKRKRSNIEPVFSSRMEKREYDHSNNLFDIQNVIDIKGFLNDIRDNWNTYVSQMNHWIQKNPVKKLVVTGIFTIILGLNTLSTNAAMVEEYTYQVKNNDKIGNIARDHGVTVKQIIEANGITSIWEKKILLPKVQDRVVTASILNVRSRPNTDSSIFTKYKKGDVVKVSFEENGWAGILIEGRIYYVSSDYLTNKEGMKANTTTRSAVYVIKSGDTFTKIGRALGVAPSTIQKLNSTVDPTKLKIGQKINVPATVSTGSSKVESQEKTMYVTASSLRVRESASTNSSIVGKLKLNDPVSVKTVKNGWAEIDFNGKASFVSESYLTDKKPVSTKNDIGKSTQNNLSEYVIKRGDTFTKIGRTLGVSPSVIQELNPAVVPTKLKVGQAIKIPNAEATSLNHINVVAQIVGLEPGAFYFITSDGKTYAAGASDHLMHEVSQQQGKTVTLTLEVKRGQQKTLISLKS